MPSYLPFLSYSSSPQDENALKSASGAEKASSCGTEKCIAPNESVEHKILSGPTKKSVDVVSKDDLVLKKGGKKAGKKKRVSRGDREAMVAAKRDVSIKGDGASSHKLDREKVEKLVTQAKSHAQAVQAVKRAVFDIQLLLLGGVESETQLRSSSALLTQSEFQDVVVERSIEKKCGYPFCDKPLLPESQRKGRFRLSVSERRIYDTRETGMYCSQTCLIISKTFAVSLQVERDGLIHREKLAAIVRSVRDCKAPSSGKSQSKFADRLSDRPLDSVLAEVIERQDTEIASFEDAGPSDAIEGYTPVTSIRDWRLKKEAQHQSTASAAEVLENSELVLPDASYSTNSAIDDSPMKTTSISESSPAKGKLALMPGTLQDGPRPKSILKKSPSERTVKRSVSWGDQKVSGDHTQKTEPKVKLKTASKPRRQVKEMPQLIKKATASTSSAFIGSAVSASTNARQADEAESTHDLQDKAAVSQGIERLSLTEPPLSSTKETGFADSKSKVAEPAHADFESVQRSPSVENAMACTASVSGYNGKIPTSEGESDSTEPSTDAEAQVAERLASAKDVAAALMEAAEATAAGDLESSEAVARAGLSILSVNETSENSVSANSLKEVSDEVEGTAHVGLKWPQVELQEESEQEVSSSKAGWHDTAPKNFKLEISMFGTIWMALEEWISAATIAFIYGKEAENEEDFLSVNGREYRLQVVCRDGVSAEISRAFSNCVARVLPDIVLALGLRVPLSSIEQALGRIVRTMSFVEPLPAFGNNHWRMLVMLLLEGLSVDQVDSIGVHLSKHSRVFRDLVVSTGTSKAEYDTLRELLLPSGRLPSVSTLSGG